MCYSGDNGLQRGGGDPHLLRRCVCVRVREVRTGQSREKEGSLSLSL